MMEVMTTPAAATRRSDPTLVVDGVTVQFRVDGTGRFLRREQDTVLTAVDDISFALAPGTTLGVVGESGCGKSTLARAIAGLSKPTAGEIRLGPEVLGVRRDRATSRRIQMVFQDPVSSLNPRMTVGSMLAEILRVHRMVPRDQVRNRLRRLMEMVELPATVLEARPRNLSGGQRQRVGIARALAPQPEVLILDEATAALDVSVQAAVLQLLRNLQEELGLTMISISHDLGAIRGLCHDVAVMYLGRIVEMGPVADVLAHPRHPYTHALITAEPDLDNPRPPGAAGLPGEPPSPLRIPSGCAFRTRCSRAQDRCAQETPLLDPTVSHDQACFFPLESVGGVVSGTAEGGPR